MSILKIIAGFKEKIKEPGLHSEFRPAQYFAITTKFATPRNLQEYLLKSTLLQKVLESINITPDLETHRIEKTLLEYVCRPTGIELIHQNIPKVPELEALRKELNYPEIPVAISYANKVIIPPRESILHTAETNNRKLMQLSEMITALQQGTMDLDTIKSYIEKEFSDGAQVCTQLETISANKIYTLVSPDFTTAFTPYFEYIENQLEPNEPYQIFHHHIQKETPVFSPLDIATGNTAVIIDQADHYELLHTSPFRINNAMSMMANESTIIKALEKIYTDEHELQKLTQQLQMFLQQQNNTETNKLQKAIRILEQRITENQKTIEHADEQIVLTALSRKEHLVRNITRMQADITPQKLTALSPQEAKSLLQKILTETVAFQELYGTQGANTQGDSELEALQELSIHSKTLTAVLGSTQNTLDIVLEVKKFLRFCGLDEAIANNVQYSKIIYNKFIKNLNQTDRVFIRDNIAIPAISSLNCAGSAGTGKAEIVQNINLKLFELFDYHVQILKNLFSSYGVKHEFEVRSIAREVMFSITRRGEKITITPPSGFTTIPTNVYSIDLTTHAHTHPWHFDLQHNTNGKKNGVQVHTHNTWLNLSLKDILTTLFTKTVTIPTP